MKSRSNPYVLGVTLVIFKESTEKSIVSLSVDCILLKKQT